MIRCTACDLELEGPVERCPECGAPTREAVVSVDTSVRDRYATSAAARASEGADFEYAFGGKHTHVQATNGRPIERRRRRFRPRRAAAIVDVPALPVSGSQVIAELPPVEPGSDEMAAAVGDEAIADVGVHDLLGALRVAETDDDVAQRGEGVGPDLADDMELDDATELDLDVEDEGAEKEPFAALDIDEEPDDSDAPVDVFVQASDEPKEEIPVEAEAGRPATAAFGEYKPYVVLPKPRQPVQTEVARREDPSLAVDETPASSRRRAGPRLFAVAFVVSAVVALGIVMTSRGRPDAAPPRPPYTVTSATDPISFRVPGSWTLTSQGKGVLDLSDTTADAHVHATLIARKSLPEGLSLEHRAKQVRKELLRSLADEDASKPDPTTIGGHRAMRTQITATAVGQRVTYILTVVKTPKHFINVLAWAPADAMEAERDVLLGIVGSLRTAR